MKVFSWLDSYWITTLTPTSVCIIVAAFVVLVAYGVYSGRKQVAALKDAAARMGFSFEQNGAALRRELNPRLHLLYRGGSGKLTNVMRGTSLAGDVALFEYRYSEGGGERQAHFFQTVAAFSFADMDLPEFHMGATHWWHKLGSALGFQTIQFESHPEFGKRYRLAGEDEDAVRRFFGPPLLDYLQSLPEKPVWSIEAAAPWLIVYLPMHLAKPDQLASFRDSAASIASKVVAAARAGRTGR